MSKKHILVLSVSAGAGHVRAAQALCAAAERGFRQLRLTHVDVMDLVPAGFRKLYADSYIKLVEKMPLAWAYLYQYTDQRSAKSLFDRLRRNIERLNTRKLNRELKRLAPDAIICTHFLPAELLSRRLARGRPTPPDIISSVVLRGSSPISRAQSARAGAAENCGMMGMPVMNVCFGAMPRAAMRQATSSLAAK